MKRVITEPIQIQVIFFTAGIPGCSAAGGRGGGDTDRNQRDRIEAALLSAGGVVSQAAGQLGLSRQALYRKMSRLGIVMERKPRA